MHIGRAFILVLLGFACGQKSNLPEGFVDATNVVPDLVLELRYYSQDNFVGDTIDGYEAGRCILTAEAAKALKDAQKTLLSRGYSLKVFDAYRPQRAVNHFISWASNLEDTVTKSNYYPKIRKAQLFDLGFIAEKSGHSRGSTVDLTIVDENGKELDMGSPWDFFGPESQENNTGLSAIQITNRLLLRTVMRQNGFRPYEKEWWHFTLDEEPYPDTYFDFVIE